MYKLLLSWRYLKTRFIALASIVSVTLGVATLIVVNSVMAGFVDEMKDRLHGILSDIEMQAPGLGEIRWPELHAQEIQRVVGDDLLAMTYVVRVPALVQFEYQNRQWTQQIMLMGIDSRSYGEVTDFRPNLMNENKRNSVNFELEEGDYDSKLGRVGWPYRRDKVANQRRLDQLLGQSLDESTVPQVPDDVTLHQQPPGESEPSVSDSVKFTPLPDQAPDIETVLEENKEQEDEELAFQPVDSNAKHRKQLSAEEMFDPARDQHTGVILGLAISNRKYVDPETGESIDLFMVKPGDDLTITLPTGGSNPTPVSENCTVVDFYSSNMHEYDSSFAFMPLKKLQELRQMIDPVTGESSVSSIQIKVRDGANLSEIRDKLIARFPPHQFPIVIQTWQDTQRPLLSAVNMELTILNILLFLIIAVAGFGILATFFMIVVEKTKDIGILKALGAPSRGVMSIFLGYGVSLGAVGTGVGIGLGLLFVYFINDIADFVQYVTGQEIFDPTIYYFSQIPTIVSPMMVVMVAVGAIAIAVLASVLPALRAARLHPVEALRYE